MRQERILGIGLGMILAGGLATSAPAALVDGLESIDAARWHVALPQPAARVLAHTELDLAPAADCAARRAAVATEALWTAEATFAPTVPVIQHLAAADLMLLPRAPRLVAPGGDLVVQLR